MSQQVLINPLLFQQVLIAKSVTILASPDESVTAPASPSESSNVTVSPDKSFTVPESSLQILCHFPARMVHPMLHLLGTVLYVVSFAHLVLCFGNTLILYIYQG